MNSESLDSRRYAPLPPTVLERIIGTVIISLCCGAIICVLAYEAILGRGPKEKGRKGRTERFA